MVEVRDVSFRYGKKQVLEHISLEIPGGKRAAITGRNGCGKSTLLQILAGVRRPDQGQILYFGKEPQLRQYRSVCGYVPQDNPLFEELTVRENLMLWNHGRKEISRTVLAMNGLEELLKNRVSTLSGGMKRRLTIACAMLELPPVMLMDEPTTALDSYYKEQVHAWMQRYQDMGGTLIMVTHDPWEIESCDLQFRIEEGTLKQEA